MWGPFLIRQRWAGAPGSGAAARLFLGAAITQSLAVSCLYQDLFLLTDYEEDGKDQSCGSSRHISFASICS